MPLPANLSTITVTGTYIGFDGKPLTGTVQFDPSATLLDPVPKVVVVAQAIKVTLDGSGSFSTVLPATNDPDLSPVGYSYRVTETFDRAGSRSYSIQVPFDAAGPLDVTTLSPIADTTIQPNLFVRKTANETVNNSSTPQDDDHLTLTVAPNAVYTVEAFLLYEATVTADLKIVWSGPVGAGFNWSPWGVDFASSSSIGTIDVGGRVLSSQPGLAGAGPGAQMTARPMGTLVVGITGGTFKLQWAQRTAEVSDTIMYAGSWLRLRQVA